MRRVWKRIDTEKNQTHNIIKCDSARLRRPQLYIANSIQTQTISSKVIVQDYIVFRMYSKIQTHTILPMATLHDYNFNFL